MVLAFPNPDSGPDGEISISSIESRLVGSGPQTLDQLVSSFAFAGNDIPLFREFLARHTAEFECDSNGLFRFTYQPRPVPRQFATWKVGIAYGLQAFPDRRVD